MSEEQILDRPVQQARKIPLPTKPASNGETRWGRGKWVALVVGFFLFQAGFVFVVIDHPMEAKKQVRMNARVVAGVLTEERAAETFFASDPRLFPLASQHGFSGRAWLTRVSPSYELPDEVEEPQWLGLRTDMLGRLPLERRKGDLPFQLGEQRTPAVEALPVFVPVTAAKTNSMVLVHGALAERSIGSPIRLPARVSNEVLQDSVVELAVNGAGEVVARRLVSDDSAPKNDEQKKADQAALEQAKTLRFQALNAVGTIWGTAVFEWATVEEKK